MHQAAYAFVRECADKAIIQPPVLEFGSININGNVRELFPSDWYYLGIDEIAGRNVDIVVENMLTWEPPAKFGTIVCTEVLEHRGDARALFARMASLTSTLILTCAGEGRYPHPRNGGPPPPPPGEFYQNIRALDLADWTRTAGFLGWNIRHILPEGDVQLFARRA